MMAPQFEQASMLNVCIRHAVNELMRCIDRIDIDQSKVTVWAGNKRLTIRATYANHYGPGGEVLVGGGNWVVAESKVENS
jgi:hypothetical protein